LSAGYIFVESPARRITVTKKQFLYQPLCGEQRKLISLEIELSA